MNAASVLREAAAWTGLAANTALSPEDRLQAALRAIIIYERYMDRRTAVTERTIRYVIDHTYVDALVTVNHVEDLVRDIMVALSDAGLIGDPGAE